MEPLLPTATPALKKRLGSTLDFGPPPADANKEKAPVVEELRRLAFEGVADELEDPANHEQRKSVEPKAMYEGGGDKDGDRKKNERNAEGVAETIYRMLVAGGVLRDPLLARAIP